MIVQHGITCVDEMRENISASEQRQNWLKTRWSLTPTRERNQYESFSNIPFSSLSSVVKRYRQPVIRAVGDDADALRRCEALPHWNIGRKSYISVFFSILTSSSAALPSPIYTRVYGYYLQIDRILQNGIAIIFLQLDYFLYIR